MTEYRELIVGEHDIRSIIAEYFNINIEDVLLFKYSANEFVSAKIKMPRRTIKMGAPNNDINFEEMATEDVIVKKTSVKTEADCGIDCNFNCDDCPEKTDEKVNN